MKKLFLIIIILTSITTAYSQEKKDRLKFNEIPGNFVFDIGLTHYRFSNGDMQLRTFASRGANIYYTYDINLIGENFSVASGLGVGITNYSFANRNTLVYDSESKSAKMLDLADEYGNLRKSKLNANYIDIPLEFRWRSANDVNSFKIVLGAKAGVLVSSHTKLKFKNEDGMQKEKHADDFELNRFRYGVYGKIGYGVFHLFGYYSLSELFNEGKAPGGRSIVPYTLGISISAF
ncbi:MAG TPA: porin family protein [Cytophagales bacterium]|nr:porin family protein [Cytophagales bacterium]